jgi:hypothetical protein
LASQCSNLFTCLHHQLYHYHTWVVITILQYLVISSSSIFHLLHYHHMWVVIIRIETLFVSSFITDVDFVIVIETWVSSQFLNPTQSPQSSVWDECKACGQKAWWEIS